MIDWLFSNKSLLRNFYAYEDATKLQASISNLWMALSVTYVRRMGR